MLLSTSKNHKGQELLHDSGFGIRDSGLDIGSRVRARTDPATIPPRVSPTLRLPGVGKVEAPGCCAAKELRSAAGTEQYCQTDPRPVWPS